MRFTLITRFTVIRRHIGAIEAAPGSLLCRIGPTVVRPADVSSALGVDAEAAVATGQGRLGAEGAPRAVHRCASGRIQPRRVVRGRTDCRRESLIAVLFHRMDVGQITERSLSLSSPDMPSLGSSRRWAGRYRGQVW